MIGCRRSCQKQDAGTPKETDAFLHLQPDVCSGPASDAQPVMLKLISRLRRFLFPAMALRDRLQPMPC